jgi:hypothetical protein
MGTGLESRNRRNHFTTRGDSGEKLKQQWWYINDIDTLTTTIVRPVGFRSPIQPEQEPYKPPLNDVRRLPVRIESHCSKYNETLLHSKAECGIWVNYKKSPITSPKFCRRMPVIRIGHGSTAYQYEAAPTRIGGVQ